MESSSILKVRFPEKLWALIHDCRHTSVQWTKDGRGIVINQTTFKEQCMKGQIFRAKKFKSILNAFNNYGFKRWYRHRTQIEFRHYNFVRNQPKLLKFIVRKRTSAGRSVRKSNSRTRKKNQLKVTGSTRTVENAIPVAEDDLFLTQPACPKRRIHFCGKGNEANLNRKGRSRLGARRRSQQPENRHHQNIQYPSLVTGSTRTVENATPVAEDDLRLTEPASRKRRMHSRGKGNDSNRNQKGRLRLGKRRRSQQPENRHHQNIQYPSLVSDSNRAVENAALAREDDLLLNEPASSNRGELSCETGEEANPNRKGKFGLGKRRSSQQPENSGQQQNSPNPCLNTESVKSAAASPAPSPAAFVTVRNENELAIPDGKILFSPSDICSSISDIRSSKNKKGKSKKGRPRKQDKNAQKSSGIWKYGETNQLSSFRRFCGNVQSTASSSVEICGDSAQMNSRGRIRRMEIGYTRPQSHSRKRKAEEVDITSVQEDPEKISSFKRFCGNVQSTASSSVEICGDSAQMNSRGRIRRMEIGYTCPQITSHSRKRNVEEEGITSARKEPEKISASRHMPEASYGETSAAFQLKEGARNFVQRCRSRIGASLRNIVRSKNQTPTSKGHNSQERVNPQITVRQRNYASGSAFQQEAVSSSAGIVYMTNELERGSHGSTTEVEASCSRIHHIRSSKFTTARMKGKKYKADDRPPPEALDMVKSTCQMKGYRSYRLFREVKDEPITRSPYMECNVLPSSPRILSSLRGNGVYFTKKVHNMTINYSPQRMVMKNEPSTPAVTETACTYPVKNSPRTPGVTPGVSRRPNPIVSFPVAASSHGTNESRRFAKAEKERQKMISRRAKRKNIFRNSHCSITAVPDLSIPKEAQPPREVSNYGCFSSPQLPVKNNNFLNHMQSPRSLVPARRGRIQRRNASSTRAQYLHEDEYGCLSSSPICIPADDDEDDEWFY